MIDFDRRVPVMAAFGPDRLMAMSAHAVIVLKNSKIAGSENLANVCIGDFSRCKAL